MSAQDVAGATIAQVHANLDRLFRPDALNEVFPDVPAPRVTLDLPGDEPEPLHVFVWGTARDFTAEGFVTGAVMTASFSVWVTCVASASTAEEASRIADAYQAMVMQMCLVSPTLNGLCDDAEAPAIRESEAWVDQDGRRHAGYLIELVYTTTIQASPPVARLLEGGF